jgi:hypothetical protein
MRTEPPPSRRLTRFGLVAVALLMLGNTGCVVYEKQTIVVAPMKGKELRMLLVYEGVRVSGPEKQDLDAAREELTGMAENNLFFGGHYMAPLELEPVLTEREKPSEDARVLRAMFKKHARLEAGEFWLNTDGRLCFSQTITVPDAPALLADANGMISAKVKADTTRQLDAIPRPQGDDLETIKLMQKASSEKGFEWIKVASGRISFTIPSTPATATFAKRYLFDVARLNEMRKEVELLSAAKNDKDRTYLRDELTKSLRLHKMIASFLSDAPLSFDQKKDRVIVSLGFGDDQPVRVVCPVDENPDIKPGQDAALIAHARTLKVPFKEGRNTEAVIADFLKK